MSFSFVFGGSFRSQRSSGAFETFAQTKRISLKAKDIRGQAQVFVVFGFRQAGGGGRGPDLLAADPLRV